ncbi:MBL fold metallo-hydrolase [Tundrisphaera sp. TA3]|uniref:MBL fold metallo-hydrolase n=1 Tax=Tundrisphaera sp. TA3 TaxID=3435775 RepID=UPI003EBB413A
MPDPNYVIEMIESALFAQNCYVLRRKGSTQAIVIDPGFDTRAILDLLRREGLTPAAILNTHGHADHIAGNAAIKAAFPDAPLWIGVNDGPLLTDPEANLSRPFGQDLVSPPADRLLLHGETIDVAGFRFEVREIPGHSPGSVVFIDRDEDPALAFVGDVLFAGSVGRTDLGGDGPGLLAGIKARLLDLPDDTLVFSGHGPLTTIGAERRTNPFVGEQPGAYRLD